MDKAAPLPSQYSLPILIYVGDPMRQHPLARLNNMDRDPVRFLLRARWHLDGQFCDSLTCPPAWRDAAWEYDAAGRQEASATLARLARQLEGGLAESFAAEKALEEQK